MNIVIINHPNSVEVHYNDLVNMEGTIYKKRTIPKNMIKLSLEKQDLYVEITITDEEPYQITSEMVTTPSTQDNNELFEILSSFLF